MGEEGEEMEAEKEVAGRYRSPILRRDKSSYMKDQLLGYTLGDPNLAPWKRSDEFDYLLTTENERV